MSNIISSWVSRLRGRREGAEPTSLEAGLVQVSRETDGGLAVRSTLSGEPLFRVRASLASGLEEEPGPDGAHVVTIPLAPEAARKPWLRVQVRQAGSAPARGEARVVRSRVERRRDAQILEFRVDAGGHDVSYRFEGDPALESRDVASAQPLPSLFAEVPATSAMADFLHQVTHERRRVPQILASLARSASPATVARAEEIAATWPAVAPPDPAVAALGRICAGAGHRVNADALHAFCLLLELEHGGEARVSAGSAMAVADLFGIQLDEATWSQELGAFGAYAEARAAADEPATARLVAHLRDQRRSPLDILDDLGRDTGSRRVAAATRHLRPLLPGGRLRVNDEQQALLPLLQASGRPVHPETMLALCLFVDLETGDLPLDRAEALPAGAGAWDTSIYAMLVVAGAFGLKLEACTVEGDSAGDEAEVVGRLAARAEGGLLACFRRPGDSARFWEWLRDEDGFRRAESAGLDFSGLLVAHFPEGWGDAALRPLEPVLLHGHGEVLSREHLALRQIQAALRRLVHPVDRVSLSQEPELLEAACAWLLSGGAASTLDPLVHGETRRQLVQALRREGLDVRVDRRLAAAAASRPPALELLGLFLLQELCASPHLKLEGNYKHFDERALRGLLLERASHLLASEDSSLRTLAPRLLAAGDLAADRATRLGTEYPLGMARTDVDPAVQASAVEALTRLALAELVPLPRAVELVPARDDGAGLPSTPLSAADREATTHDLQNWLAQVSKADSVRPMGLPITDAAGALDPEKVQPLVEILGGLQQASRQDGTLGRPRWLALASLEDLAGCARAVVESWRLLARQEAKALADLDPQECSLEHRLLVEDQASRLLQRCGSLPSLGGSARPLALFRVAPGRPAGPWINYEKYRGVVVTEEAPLFTDLLERARRTDLRRVRVLRFPNFKPVQPEGTPERQTARIDTPVELREVDVLDPRHLEFVPMLRWIARNPAEVGLEAEPPGDLHASLALAEGRRPQPEAAPPAEAPVGEEPRSRDEEAFPKAASALARQFELDGAHERLLRLLHQTLGG